MSETAVAPVQDRDRAVSNDRAGAAHPMPWWAYAVAIIAVSALSALQVPYNFGHGNQVFQIPTVHQLMDPELFPGDALVESLRNYPTLVYPTIAWLSGTLGVALEPLYLALWLLERVLMVGLFMLIAARFVENFYGRVFVTLVACTSHWAILQTLVGGEHILTSLFTHTSFTFTLHLAALAAWLHRRPMLAGAAMGAAVYLNVMTTVHFAGFLLLLLLLSGKWRGRDGRVAVATAAVIAAPFLVHVARISLGEGGAAEHSELFWELQFALPNHHFLMGFWAVPTLVSLGLTLALAACAGRMEAPLRHIAASGAIYLAAMYAVSLLGAHLFPSKLVLMLHPLRGDKALHLALVIVLPIFIWQRLSGREVPRPALVLVPPLAALFMLGARPPGLILVALPLLVAVHLLLSGGEPRGRRVKATVVVLAGLTIAALVLFAVPSATTMALVILLGVLGSLVALHTRRWGVVALSVVLAISIGQIARNSFDLSEGRFAWYRAKSDMDFDDIARWADRNTDLQARFITPPSMEGWRSLSRRSTLVEYRDGSGMDWYPRFELGWWERLEALDAALMPNHPDLHEELARRYIDLPPERLAAAARAYQIDWVIMPVEWPHAAEFRPVYRNDGYQAFAAAALDRIREQREEAEIRQNEEGVE